MKIYVSPDWARFHIDTLLWLVNERARLARSGRS